MTCTHKQLRNKIAYELRMLRSGDAEQRFRKRYAERHVTGRDDEDGMSWLSINNTTDQVRLAHHRLTLAAKQKRAAGDDRTLDQLRADLAIDLLVGRADAAPVPAYARPIVNVTVPIQTLMGLSDDPGVLSGGTVIPAGLARMIAQQPGSTWHRMLTDPAGRMAELSTESYQPTRSIWSLGGRRPRRLLPTGLRHARHGGRARPSGRLARGTHRHREPVARVRERPQGQARTRLRDRAGRRRQRTPCARRPGSGTASTAPSTRRATRSTRLPWRSRDGFQFSATELVEAITHLRELDADLRPFDVLGLWEAGADDELDQALDELCAVA